MNGGIGRSLLSKRPFNVLSPMSARTAICLYCANWRSSLLKVSVPIESEQRLCFSVPTIIFTGTVAHPLSKYGGVSSENALESEFGPDRPAFQRRDQFVR